MRKFNRGLPGIERQVSDTEMQRLKFIDGLRGVAILLVMCYHFYYLQILDETSQGSALLESFTRFGKSGVYVFFVVSGFIISYVTFNKVKNWNYLWLFIMRRQIRLDPPFWFAIALALAVNAVSIYVLGNEVYMPTVWDIFTNITYTFRILGNYDIVRVGWTLCLEVQFYVVFIFIAFVIYKYRFSSVQVTVIYTILLGLSILCAVLFDLGRDGFIAQYWYVFFLGIAAAYTIRGQFSFFYYLFTISLVLFLGLILNELRDQTTVASVVTSCSIVLAVKLNKQSEWLSNTFFQFFGRISYSLYLTHVIIGNRIIRYIKSLTHWEFDNVWLTAFILSIAFIISILVAWMFYNLIEKRSIRWAKNFAGSSAG